MIFIIPTHTEAEAFINACPTAHVEICGVGMAQCAARVSQIIAAHALSGQQLILAGIAGAYHESGIEVGSVVEVVSEEIEELPERFREQHHSSLQLNLDLPRVSSNSVCSSSEKRAAAQIENMEGASFFAICQSHNVAAAQLRAISNYVGEPFEQWQLKPALEALTATLLKIYNQDE